LANQNPTPRAYLITWTIILIGTPVACLTEWIWDTDPRIIATTALAGIATFIITTVVAGTDKSRSPRP
jgi:hypothetical protein